MIIVKYLLSLSGYRCNNAGREILEDIIAPIHYYFKLRKIEFMQLLAGPKTSVPSSYFNIINLYQFSSPNFTWYNKTQCYNRLTEDMGWGLRTWWGGDRCKDRLRDGSCSASQSYRARWLLVYWEASARNCSPLPSVAGLAAFWRTLPRPTMPGEVWAECYGGGLPGRGVVRCVIVGQLILLLRRPINVCGSPRCLWPVRLYEFREKV